MTVDFLDLMLKQLILYFRCRLPHQQHRSLSQNRLELCKFVMRDDQGPDPPIDVPLRLPTQIIQMIVINVAHKKQVDDTGVLALNVVVHQISGFDLPQASDDAVDHLIQANDLGHHSLEFRKQGVFLIGRIQDLPSAPFRNQQLGLAELVQFFPDCVGGKAELIGKPPEIGLSRRVEKKTNKELDPCFG